MKEIKIEWTVTYTTDLYGSVLILIFILERCIGWKKTHFHNPIVWWSVGYVPIIIIWIQYACEQANQRLNDYIYRLLRVTQYLNCDKNRK